MRAWVIPLVYAVFGCAWILFSDALASRLAPTPEVLARIQLWKGWTFVAVTAGMLWALSAEQIRAVKRAVVNRGDLEGWLFRIGQQVARTSRPELADLLCASALQLTGAPRAAYFQMMSDGRTLMLASAAGFSHEEIESARPHLVYRLGERKGIVGLVAATGTPVYLANCDNDDRWEKRAEGVRSAFWAPVSTSERLMGVLAVFATSFDGIDADRRSLVESYARYAGPGLEISRLLDETEAARKITRDLVHRSPAGIFELDPEGRILMVNPAVAHACGFEDPDTMRVDMPDARGLFVDPAAFAKLLARIQNGETVEGEEIEVHGRGRSTRTMLLGLRPVRDAAGVIIKMDGTSFDITPRKQAEVALQRVNRELQSALTSLREAQALIVRQERIKALGELASGVAHDLNNNLTPIIGFTELLLMDSGLADPVRRKLESIRAAASDAAAYVARLRSYARGSVEEDRRVPVALGKLVVETVELTRPRWRDDARHQGKAIELQTEVDNAIRVTANAVSLREALVNLVFNAVDAISQSGLIIIRARQDGEFVALEVADNGAGMPPGVLARASEPFFTTKGDRGSGLGLMMVRKIAEEHGGRLEIESLEGRGTTMRLRLPATS